MTKVIIQVSQAAAVSNISDARKKKTYKAERAKLDALFEKNGEKLNKVTKTVYKQRNELIKKKNALLKKAESIADAKKKKAVRLEVNDILKQIKGLKDSSGLTALEEERGALKRKLEKLTGHTR